MSLVENSLFLLRLTNPYGIASLGAQELLETWEQKVWERAVWKNDPANQGIIGSLWTSDSPARTAFINNATRQGRLTHKQVLAIISAYREVAKATGKSVMDQDFVTRMIAVQPELLAGVSRLDVAASAALVPGWIEPSDGDLYRWLQGGEVPADAKARQVMQTLSNNVSATSSELQNRLEDTKEALKMDFLEPSKKILTLVAAGAVIWGLANLKTLLKR
jgi:hypothetical protein